MNSAFTSWGRYPRYDATILKPTDPADFIDLMQNSKTRILPVGMGRSYGDSCLLHQGSLLVTTGMNSILEFNPSDGVLTAEGGVTLSEILSFAVPQGFFLPVTPGTKYVTIGGAIANDIHGKNHHIAGCFGNHILEFELLRSDGSRRMCSRTENRDWFEATIGGLGLTGWISWARIRLKSIVTRMIDQEAIQFHGIDEFLQLASASEHVNYTVAWVDCVATGRNFLRGIYLQGNHSEVPGDLNPSKEPSLVFPIDAPGFALNRTTVGIFNTAYFHKQLKSHVNSTVDYEPFFYPLDKLLHWNRLYGKSGLLQFQCALPWDTARDGIVSMMRDIADSGLASFLAVLKTFGDIQSPGWMSFPIPGITLALDFPIKADKSFKLYRRLADMTLEYGGRIYPAKDAAMKPDQFQKFYPKWEQLTLRRDPKITSSFWERVTCSQ